MADIYIYKLYHDIARNQPPFVKRKISCGIKIGKNLSFQCCFHFYLEHRTKVFFTSPFSSRQNFVNLHAVFNLNIICEVQFKYISVTFHFKFQRMLSMCHHSNK